MHGTTSSWIAGGGCTALFGEVGTGATHAEVEQAGTITRREVEAPTGAFVACAESDAPFVVRVFTAEGHLLHEHREPASDLSRYASRLAALRKASHGNPSASAIRTRSIRTVRWADGTESEWES